MRLTGGWIGITSLSDERRAINGLEFASRCGVHPVWLQEDYTALLELLKQPKDRWNKTAEKFTSSLRNFRKAEK